MDHYPAADWISRRAPPKVFVTHDLDETLFVGNGLLALSPFWSTDDGTQAVDSELVMDVRTPGGRGTGVEQTAEFQAFIANVRRRGFDPTCRQSLGALDLSAARSQPERHR